MTKPAFKIYGVEYSFKDVSLRDYYRIKEVLQKPDTREAEFEIAEAMTGCPVDQLRKLKFPDWLLIWEEIAAQITTLSQNTESISPIIEFKDKKFGLPKIEDLTIGEFADLDIILSGGNAEGKMAEIAAVLYRPIVKQKGNTLILEDYNSAGFKERVEEFQDFPLSGIRSANAFFLQSANSLLRNTAESLAKKIQKQNLMSPEGLEALQSLLLQEPGGALSIQLQEKILLDLTKLPSSRYGWRSTGLLGKKINFVNTIWPFRRKQNTK